jgi:hypothetical protein
MDVRIQDLQRTHVDTTRSRVYCYTRLLAVNIPRGADGRRLTEKRSKPLLPLTLGYQQHPTVADRKPINISCLTCDLHATQPTPCILMLQLDPGSNINSTADSTLLLCFLRNLMTFSHLRGSFIAELGISGLSLATAG